MVHGTRLGRARLIVVGEVDQDLEIAAACIAVGEGADKVEGPGRRAVLLWRPGDERNVIADLPAVFLRGEILRQCCGAGSDERGEVLGRNVEGECRRPVAVSSDGDHSYSAVLRLLVVAPGELHRDGHLDPRYRADLLEKAERQRIKEGLAAVHQEQIRALRIDRMLDPGPESLQQDRKSVV